MRTRSFRALAVSSLLAVLLTAVSASALQRDRISDPIGAPITRIIQKIRKLIIVTLSDTMSIPRP